MALARGLATHPDAARRRAAYDGELAAWETVAVPLAAALNGAKGELAVLNRRRGFADDLEPALRCNNVDRATLDAMTEAVVDVAARASAATSAPRRGCSVTTTDCPWWDLFAPVGDAGEVAWAHATELVRDAFGGFSAELAGARRRARSPSTGSTPRSATASAAARTARRSTATSAA